MADEPKITPLASRAEPVSNTSWDLGPTLDKVFADDPPAAPAAPATPVVEEPTPAPAAKPAPAPAPAPSAEPADDAAVIDSPIPADLLPKAPAVEAEPPAAAEDDDDDDAPEDTPKAKNAWSKIKAEKKALAQRVKDLEAKVAQADATKPPEMQALIDLKKQVEEYEEKLGQLDVTQTRSFKERFDAPMGNIVRKGLSVLLRTGQSQEQAQATLRGVLAAKTQNDLDGFIADQPVAVQGALFTIATEYQDMAQARDEAVKNWRDTRAMLQTQESKEQALKLAENVETTTSTAIDAAVREGNWMFAKVNGNEAWNKGVEERTRAVKGLLRSASREELTKYVVEGLTAAPLRQAYAALYEQVQKLTGELKKREAMSPRLAGGQGPAPAKTPSAGPKSPTSVIDELFPGSGPGIA